MSSSQSYSSTSYSSYSSSSSSNGQASGQRYETHSSTEPSGTTVRTASQNLGEPVVEETRQYDSQGQELLEGGSNSGAGRGLIQDVEVEDVTDAVDGPAAERYKAAMEDEYAKREGGA